MLHVLTLVCFALEVLAEPSPEERGEHSKNEKGQSSLSQILPTATQMIPTSDQVSSLPKSCQEIKGTAPSNPSGHYTTDGGGGNAGVVYCDTVNIDSQVKIPKALPSTHWQEEKQHMHPWTESIGSYVRQIMGNQESIKQTLDAVSTKIAATNTFVEQVASMEEKISQALATASEVIHALVEKNKELLKNQESLSKKLSSMSKVVDKIIQDVAKIQWSSNEVQERLALTGDDTYQLVKQLATNQNTISETLYAIATSTINFSKHPSIITAQDTLGKETNTLQRLVQKTEKTFAPSSSDEEVLLQPIEGYYPSSCQSVKIKHPLSKSGTYTLYNSEGQRRNVFCHFDLCNTPGHWTQVAFLNMSNSTQTCPSGLTLYSQKGVRACGRTGSQANCHSMKFPIISPFQQVCGRIIGYQFGKTDGFSGDNISAPYVDGVSLTYGSPRKHIWSFAAVQFLSMYHWCPCVGGLYSSTSDIIGSDYFCETGYHGTPESMLYTDNPLWDGKGCTNDEALCCQVSGIPWFHKHLDTTTTDFIELRLCGRQAPAINNTPLTLYEIYVK